MRRLALLVSLAIASPAALATNHVHLVKQKRVRTGPAPTPSKPPKLVYYGGHVLANVKVVAVFWGPSVDPKVKSDIGTFYSDLVTSPMFDWLSEYDTPATAVDGRAATRQRIGHGSFAKAVTIAPRARGNPLKDAQIKAELASQIKAGNLPAPDENTLFVVHFAPRQTIKMEGLSCKDFCGYHGTINQTTYYVVLPDQGPGSGCEPGCGKAGPFGNLTATAAHEVIEAVTDPQVGAAGKTAGYPLAWYDANKDPSHHEWAEIGDICGDYEAQLKGASGKTWTVQKMWSNRANGCIVQRNDAAVVASALNPDAGARTPAPVGKAKTPAKSKAKPSDTQPASTTPPRRRPMAG